MSRGLPEPETYLELGMAAFALTIAGAAVALLFGRLAGGLDNGRKRATAAPGSGQISDERHQHVGTSSPR